MVFKNILKNNLGIKIKKYRKKIKISIQTLSSMFEIDIKTVNLIENKYWNDTLYYYLPLMEKIEYYLLEIIKENKKIKE